MIQNSVKKQANVDMKLISPISHADKCFIPALFVAGEHDDFIKKHHAEEIYEKYAGDKNNSPRPKFMFDSAAIFLQTCLQIPSNWALPVPPSMNLMCPPWYFEMYHNRSMKQAQRRIPKQSSSRGMNGSDKDKNGFDDDNVGMTQERQREIQASLFKMLGQQDEEEADMQPKQSSKRTHETARS